MPRARVTGLYFQHGPAIFSLCRRLLRDDVAAEDATQETFIRVYRHLDGARDAKEIQAWIYRIATNYCLNEIRDRKNRPVPSETLPEIAVESLEALLGDRELVRRILSSVPENQRVIAWLHHAEGMTQDEVAAVVGVSRRTVVTRLAEFEDAAARLLRRVA